MKMTRNGKEEAELLELRRSVGNQKFGSRAESTRYPSSGGNGIRLNGGQEHIQDDEAVRKIL